MTKNRDYDSFTMEEIEHAADHCNTYLYCDGCPLNRTDDCRKALFHFVISRKQAIEQGGKTHV